MVTIKLDFPKSETRLAGFPYGESVFKNQVESLFKYDKKITIIFPSHIEKIASSFVQGFFAPIIALIGYKGVLEKITIISGSQKLTDSILKNIY